ncbi:phage tail protein, partial [Streptomyces albidoflavus]|uniref:phage tail protein n=1 Tax=Streptomyces albidoflavus TaxID=1886 RepID=UPI0033330294
VAGLAPIIADLAMTIGPILSAAIDALGPALASIGPALVTVFTAFGEAVKTIADSGALDTLAKAIGDILVALAPLLPALAQLLVPVLQLLGTVVSTVVAPALNTLVGWITQAVNWLTGQGLSEDSWLMRVIRTIAEVGGPIFEQVSTLIGKIFNDLVTWFTENKATVEEWGNRIISIIKTAGEIIAGVFEAINIAWDTFGKPLLDLIGGVFSAILQVIDGVMQAIKGIIDIVLGVITGDWDRVWTGIKEFFGGIWEAIKGILSAAWEVIKFQISNALAVVGETWDGAWNKVKNLVVTVWDAITSWINDKVTDVKTFIGRLAEIPGQVSGWFGQVKQSIVDRFNEAVDFVRSIPGRIKDALGNLGSLLWDSGRSIVQGLIDGISSMIANAVGTVTNLLNEIRNRLPFSPAKEGPFSGKGWTLYSGRSMAADLAKGLAQGEGLVSRAADRVMGAASMS